jgi:hypothetical protein
MGMVTKLASHYNCSKLLNQEAQLTIAAAGSYSRG